MYFSTASTLAVLTTALLATPSLTAALPQSPLSTRNSGKGDIRAVNHCSVTLTILWSCSPTKGATDGLTSGGPYPLQAGNSVSGLTDYPGGGFAYCKLHALTTDNVDFVAELEVEDGSGGKTSGTRSSTGKTPVPNVVNVQGERAGDLTAAEEWETGKVVEWTFC